MAKIFRPSTNFQIVAIKLEQDNSLSEFRELNYFASLGFIYRHQACIWH